MSDSISEEYLDNLDPDNNYFADNLINFDSYNLDTFKDTGITQIGSLNIMHHNARSILAEGRMTEYDILLSAIDNPFHIMGFSETWLNDSNVNLVSFNDFTSVHSLRTSNVMLRENGGGVSIFVRNNIDFKVREDLNLMLPFMETLFIEFSYEGKKYVAGLIYRVPNTNIKLFLEKLDELVEPVRNNYELILMGDYNICLLQDNIHTNSFCDKMITHNLFPTITQPTRESTVLRNGNYVSTRTLIDNFFMNTQLNYQAGLIYSGITDHYPIFISIKTPKNDQQNDQIIIKYRVLDDHSTRKFKYALNNTLKNAIIEMDNAHSAFAEFFKQLNFLYDKYFPIKSRIMKTKEKLKPWVTSYLIQRIKERDRLNKLANRGRINKDAYKNLRNAVTKELRDAKAQFYHAEFFKFKDNIKKTWVTINNAIKNKKVANNISIVENDLVIQDDKIPNKFCDYFTTIAEETVSGLPSSDIDPKSFLRDRVRNSFVLLPITDEEIKSAISLLKNNNGLYNFSTKVLTDTRHDISEILAHVFNLCIYQSYFPNELKTGCISPIFKKGDKNDIKNYRPICSLSPISKIFEKIIYTRMISFIDKNNIFSASQYGFRKNKSTEMALMQFIDFIHNGLTKKENVGAIFMDLSKAFDVMDHNILMVKLEHYGFRGPFLDFLMTFVRNRKYFVNVNGLNSSTKTVNIGVPQGSTLGPLLFLIYVNDMKNSSEILEFVQFADDTTTMYSSDNIIYLKTKLELEGNKVIQWLIANKLVINLTKTQTMLFSNKRGNPIFNINLDNVIINEVEETTFLGIIIDKKLNWKSHIRHLCNKTSKGVAILRIFRNVFPKHILKTIYMSLIFSYLNYCNLVWGGSDKSIIDPLIKIQKKAVRIIDKASYLAHTPQIYKTHKILPVEKVYDLKCLLFSYKCINNIDFPIFRNKILQNQSVHNHNTRDRDKYRLSYITRLKICQQSFVFHGIMLWNQLACDFKNINSINIFKYKIKEYLLTNL